MSHLLMQFRHAANRHSFAITQPVAIVTTGVYLIIFIIMANNLASSICVRPITSKSAEYLTTSVLVTLIRSPNDALCALYINIPYAQCVCVRVSIGYVCGHFS